MALPDERQLSRAGTIWVAQAGEEEATRIRRFRPGSSQQVASGRPFNKAGEIRFAARAHRAVCSVCAGIVPYLYWGLSEPCPEVRLR